MGQTHEELEQEPPGGEAPDWFKRWCLRLGMSPEAPDAWCKIHVQPHITCCICLLANIAAASLASVYIFAARPYRWLHHGLAVLWVSFHTVAVFMSWRYGPLPSGPKQKLLICVCGVFVGAYNLMAVLMMFGPEEHTIFQSRLALAVFDTLFIWLTAVAAFFGLWPPDFPKSPYRYDCLPMLSSHVQNTCRYLRDM